MQVLHLVSSLDPAAGGVTQAVKTIIKGLSVAGITNEAATIDPLDAVYLQANDFIIHACGPGKTPWQYAPLLLQWLTANMARYDAVIVHGLWQYPTYAVRKAAQQLNGNQPKLLVMPHGMLDPYFQKAKGRKLKAMRNWVFWKLTESKLVNRADAMLFTCETELLLARKPFSPYHPKAEKVVGLGVEAPPPYQEQMKLAFEEKLGGSIKNYWLFISRIHKKKGVDLLVQVYLQLKREGHTLPPLVIAGPGLDTPFGAALQQSAGTNESIHFTGMLTGDAKWGAFYGCEVFILPSHQENFGIAVVEALACGKPVLISDQVNIWREIKEGNAALVQPDTLAGVLQLLIDRLQQTNTEKEALQTSSLPTYKKYFSELSATNQLVAVLKGN